MLGKRVLIALSMLLTLLFISTAIAQTHTDSTERPCPVCQTMNRADAKFCKNCGAPLQPVAAMVADTLKADATGGMSQASPDAGPRRTIPSDLEKLSREELIQLVQQLRQEHAVHSQSSALPDNSVANMTEDELRAMIANVVKTQIAANPVKVKSDPLGGLLKIIGALTVTMLLIGLIASA